ncbi:PKD domain-containing protein [Propionivibrio sp.]|uniref:PKD domain-containing protein n=1 Tax=Propionivibrio sp. TaxID=2212460 RepID=UPI003BF38D38
MNKMSPPLRFIWALWFAVLCAATGNALALPNRGTQIDNWCAQQLIQAAAPQQSRPYQAAGSACSVCHTSGNPTKTDMNTLGTASSTCTGTTCGATVNPFCVAKAPSNASITAPAAGASIAQGQSLTFTAAAATNPDGFPLTYKWVFSSGQASAAGLSVAVPMSISGAVTATLQVLNSVGMLATGVSPTRAVTVTATGNQAPSASIGSPAANTTVAPGGTVNFQGSGTDPDNNTPLTYSWSFTGGSLASSTAQNPGLVTYSSAGVFTASLTVKDSLGLASVATTRTINVSKVANQRPTATIGSPAANSTIVPGGTVSFQGSGADPDNNVPLTYNWSFPGGSPASSTAQNPGLVTYNTAGAFTPSLTVTDSLGLASLAVTRTVTVAAASLKPVAIIGTPCINVSVFPSGKVGFKGSGTGSTNLPLTYSWGFPGGSPSSSKIQNPEAVSYARVGVFTATLTITDRKGSKSLPATRVITVASPNQAPPVVGQCSVSKGDDDGESDDKKANTERSTKHEN